MSEISYNWTSASFWLNKRSKTFKYPHWTLPNLSSSTAASQEKRNKADPQPCTDCNEGIQTKGHFPCSVPLIKGQYDVISSINHCTICCYTSATVSQYQHFHSGNHLKHFVQVCVFCVKALWACSRAVILSSLEGPSVLSQRIFTWHQLKRPWMSLCNIKPTSCRWPAWKNPQASSSIRLFILNTAWKKCKIIQ